MSIAFLAAAELRLSASKTLKQVSASSCNDCGDNSESSVLLFEKASATSKMELAHMRHEIICHQGKSWTRLLSSETLCSKCAVCRASNMQILSARSIRELSRCSRSIKDVLLR